jgi:multimeric flavodoxin WrbA
MRVVAINGSPRKQGNTDLLLRTVLEPFTQAGAEIQFVELAGQAIRGCTACYICFHKQNGKCVLTKDLVNDCITKMAVADAILLGSPNYFTDVTSEMKALIDRCGMVGRANGNLFRRKLGAAVVASGRAGAIHAFDTMNHFFLINQMVIIGSTYLNIGLGQEIGEVADDQDGLESMRQLGENMLWMLKKLTD